MQTPVQTSARNLPICSGLGSNLRGSDCVVADDGFPILERRHEDAGRTGRVSAARVPREPLVERRVAAVEVIEAVMLLEWGGRP